MRAVWWLPLRAGWQREERRARPIPHQTTRLRARPPRARAFSLLLIIRWPCLIPSALAGEGRVVAEQAAEPAAVEAAVVVAGPAGGGAGGAAGGEGGSGGGGGGGAGGTRGSGAAAGGGGGRASARVAGPPP